MNSNLSKGYLCVSECNKIKWNSNSALQILILNCYPLHHPHIAVVWEGSAKKVILVPVITGAKKIKKIKLKKKCGKRSPVDIGLCFGNEAITTNMPAQNSTNIKCFAEVK